MQQKNIGGLLKNMQQLQSRMDKIQTELAEALYEGSAGNGLVKVTLTGKGEHKSITIDPSILSEDAETVGDLVLVASKQAYDKKEAAAKEKLAGITSGVLPFGLKFPGLG